MDSHNGKADVRVYFCRNSANGKRMPEALSRFEPRDDVVLESVPCSGKIDPRYLLKAFESGARAVCVLTCPSGECKLMEGNMRANRRVQAVRDLLAEAGVDPNAVRIFLPSSPSDDQSSAVIEAIACAVEAEQETAQGMVA